VTGFSPLGSSGSEQILEWMGGDPTNNLTTEYYFKMMPLLLKLQKSSSTAHTKITFLFALKHRKERERERERERDDDDG